MTVYAITTDDSGESRYFSTKSSAIKFAKANGHTEARAVELTDDALMRLLNGEGGYEANDYDIRQEIR